MYRKRNGSLGFSFTKFANAAVPNLFADTSPTMYLSLHPLRKDMLHQHQIASINFEHLDERSFYIAGVVDNERMSKNVYKGLQKGGILNTDGKLDTYKIGPKFVNQLAVISTQRQKDLINMLFWWEEECHRFRKLKDEDDELTNMIREAEQYTADNPADNARKEMADQLKFARERVRMKIRQRPTQRRADTEANTDTIMDSFRGRALSAPMTVGISGQGLNNDTSVDEMLPDYHVITAK